MTTPTDEILRRAVSGHGDTRAVTLDPRFQGLPDTAHGGTVLALVDALAGATRPRVVAGVYRRRVPLGVPLALAISRDAARFHLSDGNTLLVDGTLAEPGGAEGAAAGGGGVPPQAMSGVGIRPLPTANFGGTPPPPAAAPSATSREAMILPLAKTCFACGTENSIGLHAKLTIDDDRIGGTWTPREELRRADGTLAPVALTALLDEAAFWLGAAASGESGMTTELRIALHAPVVFGTSIVIEGRRAAVRRRDDDPRYWDTSVAAWDDSGHLVASAAITFVAVRGAARKLVTGFLSVATPDVVRRVFPAYVPQ